MIQYRVIWLGLSTRLKARRTRNYCSRSKCNADSIRNDKGESSVTRYNEAYNQLQNLDFMTAAKMLFSEPVKKKKFGFDFHLVQFFFACMPSVAVYLVAQYARHEMRKMDAELEEKKKKEEETAKEEELRATEEKKAKGDPALKEVNDRLDKLESTVKEIFNESKKISESNSVTNPQKVALTKKESNNPGSKESAENDKDDSSKSGQPNRDKIGTSTRKEQGKDGTGVGVSITRA